MEYRFLKDFGDIKAGETGVLNDAWSVEEITEAVKDGTIEAVEVPENTGTQVVPEDTTTAVEDVPVKEEVEENQVLVKRYENQVVVTDGFRELDGRNIRHIKLEDGSEYDLTEVDYQTKVITS